MILQSLLVRLILVLLLALPSLVSAQDINRMGDINTRLQQLSQKMATCAPGSDCQMRTMQEMQALVQEHLGINMAQGQSMAQVQPTIPTCAGQIRPGWSCLPLKMHVSDTTDRKNWASYCTNPGLLPCDEQWYVADDLTFDYSATGSGALHYTKDFKEFEIWVRSQPTDNKVKELKINRKWRDQVYIGNNPVEKWASRTGPAGTVHVANPFSFTVIHPDNDAVTSNINFFGLSVSSTDPEMSEAYGSSIQSGNQTVKYMMTPAIIKEMVTTGQFSKTLQWKEKESDGRSYEAHTVKFDIEAQAIKPEKPGALVVSPSTGFSSNRSDPKKPFAPLSKTYTLKNTSDKTINFIVARKAKWLTLDKTGGSLPPGGSSTVTVAVDVPVAGKLAEDTYKDTVIFTNTTDGKGSTTRSAEISLAEEQIWQVWLTGQETDDIGGKAMYMKIKDTWATQVVEYSVRFNYKIIVTFTIMKKKGAWVYKDGTITTASVTPAPSFDPKIFFVKSWNCTNCSKVNQLQGTSIGGKVIGNAVQLSWLRIIPNVTVQNKLILQWTAKDGSRQESMKGYSNNYFMSERFFDYASTHKLPLENREYIPTPFKQKSANDQFRQKGRHPIHMYHRYTIKRLK
ncbi:hypothetical protein [Desulfopila aestuarii]|uniref:Uncharacterized protein n=1 Tax=Desulfopila aestuarii DSM 18488 TaxID=1121416 RepID=A0A1M7Y9G0_9BACT|nr:hypothetical protein [Desulfopila aestuarii]SHO49257.1 hypothetical protein SAMN02745220_02761 [Desulfopila aestuarii DSM 18488]